MNWHNWLIYFYSSPAMLVSIGEQQKKKEGRKQERKKSTLLSALRCEMAKFPQYFWISSLISREAVL